MMYVKVVCKMFLSSLILCSTSSLPKLHTCTNRPKYTRVQKFISCFTNNTVHVHCTQQTVHFVGENIGIYCENHTKETSGLSVRACWRVCVCACARSQMHIFLSLQHTRLPLDFRQLAAKHTCLCQHDCTNTDKDSFSSIISFIGHNTYKRIDCPRNFVSKQTSCRTAINILYNLRVRSVFRSGR